jgi:hypothetical protein
VVIIPTFLWKAIVAATEPTQPLLSAVEAMLRPLVRLLIASGVTYPALCDLLRRLYVSVAGADFSQPDRRRTVSQVSVLTGIHRKEVKRLSDLPEAALAGPPPQLALATELVMQWAATPEFTDAEGNPLALPRLHAAAGPSFASLVESVSKDVRPRALLDELLRSGAVTVDGDDRVHLNQAAMIPRAGFDKLAYYFGRNLRDHVMAAASNLLGERKPFFDRAAFHGTLRADSVRRIAELVERVGSQSLLRVYKEARALAEADAGATDANQRITFGAYFLSTQDDAPPDPPAGDTRDGGKQG